MTAPTSQAPLGNAVNLPKFDALRPRVKFCGLCQMDDVAAMNELHPDYVGLVFYPPSARRVSVEEARQLRNALDSDIPTVGVFVDADQALIHHLYNEGIISIAQLHGHEDETYMSALYQVTPDLELWKAFLVNDEGAVRAANGSQADRVLLDASLGGGEPFDWALLDAINRPYILAGGLTCENVAEALALYSPWAVDVSSGIEAPTRADDGRTQKHRWRMERFLEVVRQGERGSC